MKPAGSDTLQYRVHFSLENLSVADHGTYTISFDYFVNDNPDAHNSILTAFNGGTGDDDGPHIGTGAAIGTWLNATNTFTTSGADLLTFDYNASLNLSPDAENADSFDLLFDNFSVIGPAGQIASSGFLDFESSALGIDPSGVSQRGNGTFTTFAVVAIPEPASFALLGGLLGLSWVMVRRRK